jgi:hypothetical protein
MRWSPALFNRIPHDNVRTLIQHLLLPTESSPKPLIAHFDEQSHDAARRLFTTIL